MVEITEQPYSAYTGDFNLFWLDFGTRIECRTFFELIDFQRQYPNIEVQHVPEDFTFKAYSGKTWMIGKNFIHEVNQ